MLAVVSDMTLHLRSDDNDGDDNDDGLKTCVLSFKVRVDLSGNSKWYLRDLEPINMKSNWMVAV